MIFSIYNGRIYAHKNKLVNIQELLLLLNLTIMYAVTYKYSVTNVMISLAFIQFCTIVLYRLLTYTCHVEIMLQDLNEKLVNLFYRNYSRNDHYVDIAMLNITERTYTEYQYELISEDFK